MSVLSTLLALDCATSACSVALYHRGQCVERFELTPNHHAERILFLAEDLLQEARCEKNALQAIAVGVGPGSFIGVRTAICVAQALAYAFRLPVIPLSTLQILAQTALQAEPMMTEALVAWDARMGEVYWGHYRVDANGLMQPVSLQTDCLLKPEACVLPATQNPGVCFAIGNAFTI